MKKVLVILAFLCVVAGLFAVPAYPGLINFIQPDGSELEIYLKGDEKVKWAETTDGYSILFNRDGFYEYATLNQNNDMVPSGIRVNEIHLRNQTEIDFLNRTSKHLFYNEEQISTMVQIWNIYDRENTRAFPTTGNRKLICILIGFTDKAFTKTQSDFNNLFNQVGYSIDGATGSVKDYYLQNSYNQFNLTVDVAGPYTASNNMAYYGANDANGDDVRPDVLAREAAQLANPHVNYADYDNDNDGAVDALYIIYAGYGEEAGGPANAIWAHAWAFSTITLDGKTLSRYSCSAELRGSSGTGLTRIGVICHEFGHVLGAPDYYDTNGPTGGSFTGTGSWDLMAGGSWNNGGATPAHHNGFTKVVYYNWATVTTLTAATTVTLNNAAQNSNSFYRINTTTANEYFFIENREKHLFDNALPGSGMMIYHVHKDVISAGNSNNINVGHPQKMYPKSQNATTNPTSTPSSYGSINLSTCAWTGASGTKTAFTDTSTPHSKSWAAANTAKPITNITRNATAKTVTFDFMGGGTNNEPTNFIATAASSSQINLSWTKNGGRDVLLAFSTTGTFGTPVSGTNYSAGSTISGGGTVIYAGANQTYSHTGLSANTTYYYKIFTKVTTTPTWSVGVTANATTSCGTISTFPFTETFEGNFLPACWDKIVTSGNDITKSNTQNHTTGGAYSARFSSYSTSTDYNQYLFTPMMQLPSNAQLSFWHRKHGTQAEQLYYGIGTTKNPANYTWNIVTLSDTAWQQSTVNLSAYAGQSVYIAFKYYGNYLYYVYLDDVSVTVTASIVANFTGTPTSVITGQTVTFTDASTGGTATSWSWNFGSGATPATATTKGPHNVTYSTTGNKTVSLTVNGSSTETKTNYISVLQPPVFSINKTQLAFGNVVVNTTSPAQSFIISNTGGTALTGNITTPTAYFVQSRSSSGDKEDENLVSANSGVKDNDRNSISYNIAAGSSGTFNVTFTPTSATSFNGNIVITSNDGNNPSTNLAVTGTGYIPPNVVITPTSISKTLKANTTGSETMNISNTGGQNLTYSASIAYVSRERATVNVYPTNSNYWTGSCTSSSKTETSYARGYSTQDGWMKFNVSSIPVGSTINSVTFKGYVYSTKYPYWSITPVHNDPVTTAASTLNADIVAEQTSGNYLQRNETSTYATGWKTHVLGGAVNTNLKNALAQGWFAIGIVSRDNSTSYYINFHGWNNTYKPYLIVDYTPPATNWLSLNGQQSASGTVTPGNNVNIPVNFNTTGMGLGTYQAQINITTNAPNNPTIQVPVTLTINQLRGPIITISQNNQTTEQLFTISNSGDETLSGMITIPIEQFFVSELLNESDQSLISREKEEMNSISYSIEAGSSKTYNITSITNAEANYVGNVYITSNDPQHENYTVSVSGSKAVAMGQVTRTIENGFFILSWEPVNGAITYKVYSSANPSTGFTHDTSGNLDVSSRGVTWKVPVNNLSQRFYYVTIVY
jgi:M6 family metalloprotease-like protein